MIVIYRATVIEGKRNTVFEFPRSVELVVKWLIDDETNGAVIIVFGDQDNGFFEKIIVELRCALIKSPACMGRR